MRNPRPDHRLCIVLLLVLISGCRGGADRDPQEAGAGVAEAAQCPLDGEVAIVTGAIAGGTEKQYFVLPVDIPAGTRRIEFLYGWSERGSLPTTGNDPNDTTVLDLGWWDQHGYRDPAGFRGWSGSRGARISAGAEPGYIEADKADRGYTAGPIEPGLWYAEIGVAVSSRDGADYELRVQCFSEGATQALAPDPVDPDHVANPNPGWYHGDFHMHGYHSHGAGADAFEMAEQARAAKLDVIFYTEYVVVAHWDQIGSAQRANPDLLFFPGREIISYFGHANTLGETRGVVEYRHGFEDVSMGQIQADAVAAGALFQINHPTNFDYPQLRNLCRGCQWEYDEDLNWNEVHTVEVVTGPPILEPGYVGGPDLPAAIQNPFIRTSIDFWHDKLQRGHKITAVSGSDSRGAEPPEQRNSLGYGANATAILSQSLSQANIRAAILAGRTFVKTLGVDESPHADMEAFDNTGQSVTYGGEIVLAEDAEATMRIAVRDGLGQRLMLYRNGTLVDARPITSENALIEFPIRRDPQAEGPLGTWWRFDIVASAPVFNGRPVVVPDQAITLIGNPVFLSGG